MNVSRKTLLDLLVWDGEARFVVPGWHRPYEWTDKEILPLWSDWCTAGTRNDSHFCGTVILRHLPHPTIATWELVDGEQRLATFFVAFMALRDACRDRDIDFSELEGAFSLEGSNECRLVLLEGEQEDRCVLNALLHRSVEQLPGEMRERSRLCQAYRLFRDQAQEVPRSDVPPLIVKILQNADLIVVTAQEGEVRHLREVIGAQRSQAGRRITADESRGFAPAVSLAATESPLDYISGFLDRDDLVVFVESLRQQNGNGAPNHADALAGELRFGMECAQKQTRARDWLRHFRQSVRLNPIFESHDGSFDEPRRILDVRPDSFLDALVESFHENPGARVAIRHLTTALVRLSITLERPRYRAQPAGTEKRSGPGAGATNREPAFRDAMSFVHEILMAELGLAGGQPGPALLRRYVEVLESRVVRPSSAVWGLQAQGAAGHDSSASAEAGTWLNFLQNDDPSRLKTQYGTLVQAVGNLNAVLADRTAMKTGALSALSATGGLVEVRKAVRPPPLPVIGKATDALKETLKWEKPGSLPPSPPPALARRMPVPALVVPPLPGKVAAVPEVVPTAPGKTMSVPAAVAAPAAVRAGTGKPPIISLMSRAVASVETASTLFAKGPVMPPATVEPLAVKSSPAATEIPPAPAKADAYSAASTLVKLEPTPAQVMPPRLLASDREPAAVENKAEPKSVLVESFRSTPPDRNENEDDEWSPSQADFEERPTTGWGWAPWLAALLAAIWIGRQDAQAGLFHHLAEYLGWFVILLVASLLLTIPFPRSWRTAVRCAMIVGVSWLIVLGAEKRAGKGAPPLLVSHLVRPIQSLPASPASLPTASSLSANARKSDVQIEKLKTVSAAGHGDPKLAETEHNIMQELSQLSTACHTAETQALAAGIDPITITSQDDLEKRQWAVRHCQIPIQDLLTFVQNLDATTRSELATKRVSEAATDKFIADMHHSGQLEKIAAFWKLEGAIWADVLSRLDLLQTNWGAWHVYNQTLIFDDDAAAARDQSLTQKIADEGVEQQNLRSTPSR